MGNYEQLKDAISLLIKNNNNEEINGDLLQGVLKTIISTLGDNANFAGIAKLNTLPVNTDANVFYIANENGIYSNFAGYENKNNDLIVFYNKNGIWQNEVLKNYGSVVSQWVSGFYKVGSLTYNNNNIYRANKDTISPPNENSADWDVFKGKVDNVFNPLSENAQSGKAVNEAIVNANFNFGGEITSLDQEPTVDGIYIPRIEGVYTNFNNLDYSAQDGFVLFIKKDDEINKITTPLNQTINSDIDVNNLVFGVNGKAVFEYSSRSVENITQLRSYKGQVEGEIINLLGYYEKGDKPILKYKFTYETLQDDGGSIVNCENGSWKALFDEDVDVRDFGAKSELNYDNEFHFENLINFLKITPNKRVVFYSKENEDFETSKTFQLPIRTDLLMKNFISFTNDTNSLGLVIGDNDNYNFSRKLEIRVKRKTISDWLNYNNIGVLIWNLYESTQVNIVRCQGFTTGVKLMGDAKGFVYNTITIGNVTQCRKSVVLSNINNGWCNENNVFIDRISQTTTTHIDKSRYGIVLTSDDFQYYNNNNVFYKPSIELSSKENSECRAICIEFGNNNIFKDVRNEGNANGINGSKVYIVSNESTNNIINEGFGSPLPITQTVEHTGVSSATFGISIRQEGSTPFGKPLIYESGFLPNKISAYSQNSIRATGGLFFGANTNSNKTKTTNIVYNKDYLPLNSTRGIGVTLDTIRAKKFHVETFVNGGVYGRFNIRCYDENGVLLNNQEKNHVKGTGAVSFSYFENLFRSWRTGADTRNCYFEVSEETKKIDVIISGNIQLYSFSIRGYDITTNVLENNTDNLIAIEKPIQLASNGTFYYNEVNNNVLGWVCVNNNWYDVNNFKQSENVNNVNTQDATDLPTAIALINEIKTTLNNKLNSDRNSGQQKN